MTIDLWTNVDRFFEASLLDNDPILDEVLKRSTRAGLPPYNVSPCQGQLLQIFATMIKAKRILEIGTLGGYSTIWLARSIPKDGQVVTIEIDDYHAQIAEQNLKLADVFDRVDVLCGDARAILERLIDEGTEYFDLIFIDADKSSNSTYLELSLQLSHRGTVIICDNVVREGAVADEQSTDADVVGVQTFCRQLKQRDILSSAVQTVGMKGYDGFTISIVQ